MTSPQQSQQWSPTDPQPDVQHAILAQLVAIKEEAAATRKAVSNIWTVVLLLLILSVVAGVGAVMASASSAHY
jgi:hypothetical protein